MARGVHTVTKAIAAAGHPEVRLYRGDGYHYYEFDDIDGPTGAFETQSVMCPRFSDMAHEQWVAGGIAFATKMKEKVS
jgi:serine protease inhibitor ecotin